MARTSGVRAFGPLASALLGHPGSEDILHQAVDREYLQGGIALHQGETGERSYGLVKQCLIRRQVFQVGAEFTGSGEEQVFGDGIGGQEGQQVQQVACGRIALLHLLEVERPGGRHRIVLVEVIPTLL